MADTVWTTEDKVLALAPKFSGFLSLCGSLYIIYRVLLSRERRGFVYHQILLAASCSDVLGSSMYVLSTWPIPRGEAVFSVGNQASCNFQGTLDQFASLTTPLFTGSLAIYYLLVIRFGWREEQVRKHRIWFFLIPFSLGFSTAIAGIPMELYNNADWVCWIAPWPPGCDDDPLSENPCQRGINAGLYRMVFSYAIVWVVFVVLAVSMAFIYHGVRRTEQKSARYREDAYASKAQKSAESSWMASKRTKIVSQEEENQDQDNKSSEDKNRSEEFPRKGGDELDNSRQRQKSRKKNKNLGRNVLIQAFLYCGAFYLTFIWGTIARILQLFKIPVYPILVCMTVFFPLQGFWQFLIYTRPMRVKTKRSRPDSSNINSDQKWFLFTKINNVVSTSSFWSRQLARLSNEVQSGYSDDALSNDVMSSDGGERPSVFPDAQTEVEYITNQA